MYSLEVVNNFVAKAIDEGMEVTQLNEGGLLGGDYLIEQEGYKSMLITEKYLNEWSSAYIIRRFSSNNAKSMERLAKLVKQLSVVEE